MDLKKSSMSWLNIQQQVQKNKDDIAAWNDVDKFGIKVQGKVADEASLPNPETYQGEYGDTYAVGTDTPYDYYVFTRPEAGDTYPRWFNVGQLQVKGDKGDQGETGPAGPTGERGSLWTTSNSNPSVMSTNKKNDQHLCVYNGDVFQFDGSAWNRIGNIRGPQGIQGVQGIQGPKGDTGETGPKGDTGDVGGFINIVATLKSADLLPDPATLSNLTYAYLVGDNNDLYIQIGKTSVEAHWKNMGSFNLTANHWTVNTSDQLVPANNDDVAVNNLTVLGTSSLKSPSISGVASCSAISSPATLTLSGTDGAEVLVNGTNTLTVNSNGITLPTLADPGDNRSYPVLMADSNGKILKNTGITVNPYTKTLTASSNITAIGGVNANGFYYGSRSLIADIDSKISKDISTSYIVYGTTTAGTQGKIPYADGASSNSLICRTNNGQAQVKPHKQGPQIHTDTSTNDYITNLGQLTQMHKYDYGIECWSNRLIIGDIESPKAISLKLSINEYGDQCPMWMLQLNNNTDTGTYNWSDLDQSTLLPYSNAIYWLGGIEPIFEYGKRYTLMFWPADDKAVGNAAGAEYTGALIGTWSAA